MPLTAIPTACITGATHLVRVTCRQTSRRLRHRLRVPDLDHAQLLRTDLSFLDLEGLLPMPRDTLTTEVAQFMDEVVAFSGFTDTTYTAGELRANSNWEWGYAHGVYCFIHHGEVVYVGRALTTLGIRIADQLRSQSDPAWARIVTDDSTEIRVFAVKEAEKDKAYMASALEAYLINRLKPRVNSRSQ